VSSRGDSTFIEVMDMMEFFALESGELVTVGVLALAVVAVAMAARRAQQQTPAPPGVPEPEPRHLNDAPRRRSRRSR
jgi:hypothetical protein